MKYRSLIKLLPALMLPCASIAFTASANAADAGEGYYRYPAIHQNTIVFTSEGDLWAVGAKGGIAMRLTTHHGQETNASISPDGKTIAFSAQYHGPTEVYTIPLSGGIPTRHTFEGDGTKVRGWTNSGKIIFTTRHYSDLPNQQLVTLDPKSNSVKLIELAQADNGVYDNKDKDLYFARLAFNGSQTKRYHGGTAQNLWKYSPGKEAFALTSDFDGTSKDPMWYQGRVYFATDRDRTMNIWSMDQNGKNLKQHTKHQYWDIKEPNLQNGQIVYQLGADIYKFDIKSGKSAKVKITLRSDFDQKRTNWIKDPIDQLSNAAISPDGKKVVITARGRVYVAQGKNGRLVEISRKQGVRFREARFLSNGKLLLLNDQSGEQEFYTYPANGIGKPVQITQGATVLRLGASVSPNKKHFVFSDQDQKLWLHTFATKETQQIGTAIYRGLYEFNWSPDSKWLAYTVQAANAMEQVKLYNITTGKTTAATSDRVDSGSPAFSKDGKWLYFLSDRHFRSSVGSPWGPRQPEPYLEKTTEIFALALTKDAIFPFLKDNELTKKDKKKKDTPDKKEEKDKTDKADKKDDKKDDKEKTTPTTIDFNGLSKRLYKVPTPVGRYRSLTVNKDTLFYMNRGSGRNNTALMALSINKKDKNKAVKILGGVRGYDLSADGKKILIYTGKKIAVVSAAAKKISKIAESTLNLKDWKIALNPAEEWRLILTSGWRMHRDYFYDPGMHGADWDMSLKRHLPLVSRVSSREELSDLLGQMVGDTEALHSFVYGGDTRRASPTVKPSSLGASLALDKKAGGYRIAKIYQHDPDYINNQSPLSRPEVAAQVGDVITSINGVSLMAVAHPGVLLDHQTGKEVRLRLKSAQGISRNVIVKPISVRDASNLRYTDWEVSRRAMVDDLSKKDIGYLHLRAMGNGNYTEWVKGFYPVFKRNGLIIDVRHNRGGNIDSWILEKLLRKTWLYWKSRNQAVSRNMQYAFNGHVVVLINEKTASDGEAFAEGARQLGIGKLIGTRTWGGEIWGSSNRLLDSGTSRVPSMGVFDLNGKWIIEGPGVIPDITVDNYPHETFKGKDRQLEAAVKHLQDLIKKDPRDEPKAPSFPDMYKNVP